MKYIRFLILPALACAFFNTNASQAVSKQMVDHALPSMAACNFAHVKQIIVNGLLPDGRFISSPHSGHPISPDGEKLINICIGSLSIVSIETGETELQLPWSKGILYHFSWSPDSQSIVMNEVALCDDDKDMCILNIQEKTIIDIKLDKSYKDAIDWDPLSRFFVLKERGIFTKTGECILPLTKDVKIYWEQEFIGVEQPEGPVLIYHIKPNGTQVTKMSQTFDKSWNWKLIDFGVTSLVQDLADQSLYWINIHTGTKTTLIELKQKLCQFYDDLHSSKEYSDVDDPKQESAEFLLHPSHSFILLSPDKKNVAVQTEEGVVLFDLTDTSHPLPIFGYVDNVKTTELSGNSHLYDNHNMHFSADGSRLYIFNTNKNSKEVWAYDKASESKQEVNRDGKSFAVGQAHKVGEFPKDWLLSCQSYTNDLIIFNGEDELVYFRNPGEQNSFVTNQLPSETTYNLYYHHYPRQNGKMIVKERVFKINQDVKTCIDIWEQRPTQVFTNTDTPFLLTPGGIWSWLTKTKVRKTLLFCLACAGGLSGYFLWKKYKIHSPLRLCPTR
jgi:hypothetical protein